MRWHSDILNQAINKDFPIYNQLQKWCTLISNSLTKSFIKITDAFPISKLRTTRAMRSAEEHSLPSPQKPGASTHERAGCLLTELWAWRASAFRPRHPLRCLLPKKSVVPSRKSGSTCTTMSSPRLQSWTIEFNRTWVASCPAQSGTCTISESTDATWTPSWSRTVAREIGVATKLQGILCGRWSKVDRSSTTALARNWCVLWISATSRPSPTTSTISTRSLGFLMRLQRMKFRVSSKWKVCLTRAEPASSTRRGADSSLYKLIKNSQD